MRLLTETEMRVVAGGIVEDQDDRPDRRFILPEHRLLIADNEEGTSQSGPGTGRRGRNDTGPITQEQRENAQQCAADLAKGVADGAVVGAFSTKSPVGTAVGALAGGAEAAVGSEACNSGG